AGAWALAAAAGGRAATAGGPVSTSAPSAARPAAASPIAARDHDLPAPRGPPAVLLPYTMFLHVMASLVPTGAAMLPGDRRPWVWGVSRKQSLNRSIRPSRVTYRPVTMIRGFGHWAVSNRLSSAGGRWR